jgi:hypothetical protein
VVVNNSDVNYYIVDTKITSSASQYIEEEQARKYLGIDLITYSNMVGGRRWANWYVETHTGQLENGIIICKADVIAYYRIMTRTESVINDISMKRTNKKGGK